MRRIASSKVMKKFTISLPKAVREALEIKVGDYIEWFVNEDEIVVKKSERK